MRSSNSIVQPGKGPDVAVWLPAALEQTEVKDDVNVERILSFFVPDPNRKKKGFVTSPFGAIEDAQSWNPEELDWVPPFNLSVWGEPLAKQEQPAQQAVDEPLVTVEASEVVDHLINARRQAEEIILQAQNAADLTIQQAEDEVKNSISEGYQRGWAAAQAEVNSTLTAARAVVEELNTWRNKMLAQSENTVVSMVQQIARSMFSEGVRLDEKTLEANLNRVLENAKSLGDLRIYLNQDDAGRLDPAWHEYQTLVTGNKIQIIPSDGIKPGGCFVQGQMGSVDAQVNTQLDELLEVFTETEDAMENAY